MIFLSLFGTFGKNYYLSEQQLSDRIIILNLWMKELIINYNSLTSILTNKIEIFVQVPPTLDMSLIKSVIIDSGKNNYNNNNNNNHHINDNGK